MKKLLSGILSVAAALLPLQAEVYWLGPGRGGRNSDKIAGILPGMEKVLYTEKITVNSYAAKMEISAVTGDVEEIASLLRKMKLDKLSISFKHSGHGVCSSDILVNCKSDRSQSVL